jgi:hypothetical protein
MLARSHRCSCRTDRRRRAAARCNLGVLVALVVATNARLPSTKFRREPHAMVRAKARRSGRCLETFES